MVRPPFYENHSRSYVEEVMELSDIEEKDTQQEGLGEVAARQRLWEDKNKKDGATDWICGALKREE